MSSEINHLSKTVAKEVYNRTIRSHLPRKYIVCAGVPTRDARLFDVSDRRPEYKQGLIDAIHEYVDDGDSVVLVGGGRGVTTVHCTRAGASEVTAVEAAEEMIDIARETVEIEGPEADVSFRHALVGEAIEVFGTPDGATRISPSELPDGDLLLMDCEGAERSILSGLEPDFGTVIVETHPDYDAPSDVIADRLAALGYDVRYRSYEPDNDAKHVLIGL